MPHDGSSGTRFKLFPQPPFLEAFREPETVRLSPPAGTLGPGPSDDQIYAVYPIGKTLHYGFHQSDRDDPFLYLPPWDGKYYQRPMPGETGHFDHLEPGTPQFEAAHLYGTVRFVLDVWEGYFDRRIRWHFEDDYDQMELSILPGFDNALLGYGFMEVGGYTTENGEYRPYSLNFDVIAHEVGHAIIYREVGMPVLGAAQGEYYGFHESAADLVALITSLHFDSVIDHVLERTRGNLYTLNKLNRMAELSDHEQIRLAANDYRLSDFVSGWDDEHDLAQPLTGAMFDILVDIFHEQLLDRGLIASEVEDLSDQLEGQPEYEEVMQSLFDEAFARDPGGFTEALLEARDIIGTYLADTWSLLDSDSLSYAEVGATLELVDREITGGRYRRLIRGNMRMRDIGLVVPGPRLSPPEPESHSFSVRTMVPELRLGPADPSRGDEPNTAQW
jgi:hypothetical protein